ncbi:MAG: amino acid adenylation domain-containing protein, partial [Vicinamibacterales bacterium]
MSDILRLLRRVTDAGVRLTLEDGRLAVRGPEGSLTPELRSAIAARRDDLIALLGEDAPAGRSPAIPPRPDAGWAPLSPGQRRLWLIEQLQGGGAVFNLTMAWYLDGPLDAAALGAALDDVVGRHEVLRATLAERNGEVVQVFAPLAAGRLQAEAVPAADAGAAMAALRAQTDAESARPFDLTSEPPLRVRLLRFGEHAHGLIVTMHHIASDHQSMVIFAGELAAAYTARAGGGIPRLADLPFQFGDYAHAQAAGPREDEARDLEYWRQQLDGAPRLLELPTDHARPAVQAPGGGRFSFDIDAARVAPLLALGAEHGLSPFMTLLGVYAVLLARYSGQSEVCVGCPVSSRRAPGTEALIGFFVDTLVLRVDLGGDPTLAEVFARIRKTTTGALAHPHAPFDRLVDALGVERSPSHAPLFQAMFVLQAAGMPPLRLPGVTATEVETSVADAEFDITLFLLQHGPAMKGHVEYRADLFDQSTIAQMASHLVHLAGQWPGDPSRRVSDLTLDRPEDRAQVLDVWNPPDPWTCGAFAESVQQLIAARAAGQPSAPAIVGDAGALSYAELDRDANRLAWRLVDHGAEPADRVAVQAGTTSEFVVGILGVLRAGCAYVPVPLDLPAPRLAEILGGTAATLMVTSRPPAAVDVTCIDPSAGDAGAPARDDAPRRPVDGDSPAAVYHTSGSTGAPLGVVVTHRGLAAHARAVAACYGLEPGDRVLQFAAWDFDVAAEEVLPALCSGATLVERDAASGSFAAFEHRLARHAVTVLNLPASYWEAWVTSGFDGGRDWLDALRLLVVGSERVSGAAMARWHAATGGRIRTLNAYGTTEATITTTVHEARPDRDGERDAVPVGRPLPHARVYVLDARGRLLPPLVPGEIWIGGSAVAAGYLNAPPERAERFTRDPFARDADARMFRTGDRGRWLQDGALEVVGRADRQVKLRGFRIDPGDIEGVLSRHPRVEHAAVVLARQPGAPDRLVAYVSVTGEPAGLPAPAGAEQAVADELVGFLADRLPSYMVPALVVVLDELPVTARGKIDVAALARRPLPAADGAARMTPPASPEEATLAGIWAELLGLPQVSTTDNFFELGGDSILGITMISRARARGLILAPHSLLAHQTIASLARTSTTAGRDDASPGTSGDGDQSAGPVPLSPIQERFLHEPCADRSAYHQAVRIDVPADLDEDHLRAALQAVVSHHDALRFQFREDAGGWSQAALDAPADPHLECHDLAGLDEPDQDRAEARIASRLPAGLNLAGGRLVRAALVARGPSRPATLLLVIHHLVVDAVSFSIVLDDLERAYLQARGGLPIVLPPTTTPFRAWTRRLLAFAGSDELADEVDGWAGTVEGAPAFPDAAPDGGEIRHLTSELDAARTRDLLRLVPGLYNTRIQDALLAALWIGAQAIGAGRALRVDVEGHGRDVPFADVDLTRTVGWFTTIYPVRLEASDPDEPAAVLMRVKETLRAVPNGGLGYDVLRYLSPRPEIRARLEAGGQATVLFNYLGTWRDQAASGPAGAWRARPVLSGAGADAAPIHRSHAVEINGQVVDGRLQFGWTCPAALEPRVRAWSEAFVRALADLVAHCRTAPAGAYTPSDVPLARLTPAQLLALQRSHGGFVREPDGWRRDFEDVLPLTPLQLGMLSHSLRDASGQSYLDLLALTIDGDLDEAAFRRAWEDVVARHPALRAAFVAEGVPEPLQIIRRAVRLPWRAEDWRTLDPAGIAARLAAAKAAEVRHGFTLGDAPLMRLSLLRVADHRQVLLWTTSHLILDGWSTTIVLGEVFALYDAHRGGRPRRLAAPPPFSSFVRRIVEREEQASTAYWRGQLGAVQAPTPVPLGRRAGGQPGEAPAPAGRHQERRLRLDAPLSDGLRALARRAQVTVGTLFQAAWALVCSRDQRERVV